jgi:hypothetical protein
MSINYIAVLVAAAADFVTGGIWYMAIFSTIWGKIHGFDKLSKVEQEKARKGMWPFLILQLVITIVTVWSIAKFHLLLEDYSIYTLALIAWVGFVVPTQIAAVVFGGTDPKWIVKKSLIMAGGSLVCIEIAALIIKSIH